jgi:integration host factor subunit alpha
VIVEILLEIISISLISGDDAIVSGFGKFSANGEKESKGWNPACGEYAILSATRVVMV